MCTDRNISFNEAKAEAFVERLFERERHEESRYGGVQPELSSFAQRFAEVLVIKEIDGADFEEIDGALDVFFKKAIFDETIDQEKIENLTLLEGAFIEFCGMSRVLRSIIEMRDLPKNLVEVLDLPRNKRLREAFFFIHDKGISNHSDLIRHFDPSISRQWARDLVLRLRQLGLVEIAAQDGPLAGKPISFQATPLGKRVAAKVREGGIIANRLLHLLEHPETATHDQEAQLEKLCYGFIINILGKLPFYSEPQASTHPKLQCTVGYANINVCQEASGNAFRQDIGLHYPNKVYQK